MGADGKVIYWNKQAEAIFGWSKDEALGQFMSKIIIPEEYRHLHETGLAHFLKTGEGPILMKRIEIVALRKNKEVFPVELTVTPIQIEGGYTFSAFIRDISEKKKIEQDKKNEQEALTKALRVRDEFISVCSHELKTPITSMMLQFEFADRFRKKGDSRVYTKEAVDRRISLSLKQLHRMSKLIDDMLDVSKISKSKIDFEMTKVRIDILINEVIEKFKEQLESLKIEIHFDIQSSDCLVLGDTDRLDQVFSNLINNAIKYGNGSPILITLIKLATGIISISISDKGEGIDSAKLQDIFKQFERATDNMKISGLGLGLFISNKIVEAHHGRIVVESEKGEGATFTVELPAL
jgi:PAS domain S-box-containing protein